MKDFIPLGIGVQTSGPDPDKHQLLKLSLVSFLSGARFSAVIRQPEITIDIGHCKNFLAELSEGKGRDADLADEEIGRFLGEQSKVLLDDRPAARLMKMVPTGIHVETSRRFIQKTLPKTFHHLWEDSIELASLFVLEGLRDNVELTHIRGQYKTRAEMKMTSGELDDPTLLEAYISCYILADFQKESATWMHG